MSKSHVHIQTMNKTPAKYRQDWNKTVREVAFTKYPHTASEMPFIIMIMSSHMFRPWAKHLLDVQTIGYELRKQSTQFVAP